jgi:hypothetical protein
MIQIILMQISSILKSFLTSFSSKINFHFLKAPQNDRLNTLQNCSNAIRFIKFEAYYETETLIHFNNMVFKTNYLWINFACIF